MSLFHVQGEGIGEEQKRREQMKKTKRDLQAQKEDNERRRTEDKHRGGMHKHTHCNHWWANILSAIATVNHTHASCFPAQTISHSYAQPSLPGGIDGYSSQRAVMCVWGCRWKALYSG